jgi:hypothetical protein
MFQLNTCLIYLAVRAWVVKVEWDRKGSPQKAKLPGYLVEYSNDMEVTNDDLMILCVQEDHDQEASN